MFPFDNVIMAHMFWSCRKSTRNFHPRTAITMTRSLNVGVLALQGSFAEHVFSLEKIYQESKSEFPDCTVNVSLVRKPEDLDNLDGLIIPGGESTTMAKFLERNNFQEKLVSFCRGTLGERVEFISHDDVIKWKHFRRYWPFVRGIHRSPVNSPHKGQWHGALMLSLICTWTNS